MVLPRRHQHQGRRPSPPLAGMDSRSRSLVDPVQRRDPPPPKKGREEPPTASVLDLKHRQKDLQAGPSSSSSHSRRWRYWRRRRGQFRAKSTRKKRFSHEVAAAVLVLARGWSSLRRQKAMSVRYAIARGADDGPLLPLLMSTAAKNAAAAAASNRHSQKPENLRRRFLLDHDLPGTPRPLRYLHSSDWKS